MVEEVTPVFTTDWKSGSGNQRPADGGIDAAFVYSEVSAGLRH
jgi:hypothetical protein